MWCDDFDADLLKVVPGAAETLAGTAGVKLETHSNLTDGKINCPSAWWTDAGLAAFFWTDPELAPPAGYVTDDPVVECTFLEAVRDEWVHGQILCVNRRVVWRPPERLMDKLMSDLRGWTVLAATEREGIRESVRRSLSGAVARLTVAVTQAVPRAPAGELAAGHRDPWLDRDPREDERGDGTEPCR